MKKQVIAGFLSLAMTIALAGCAGSGTTAATTQAASTDQETETTTGTADSAPADADAKEEDKAAAGDVLKVVATSETYVELFDKFTQETGIKTELLSMSSGEVLSKIKAEGGTPMADLWFGGGIDAFMGAKADDLLEPVQFDAAKDLAPEYKDSDNYWFSKGVTVVGFLVNNDIMKEKKLETPKTWDDLTDPAYKGEILMSNPAISGTNYAVVNAILQTKGEEAGWEYFKALNENVTYYSKRGKDPSVKTAAGEVAVGITYLDRTVSLLEEEQNVTVIYPEDGIPYVPEGVAVFKNASNTEAAKQFVEWFFSNDENLQMLAKIDQKETVKLVKPGMQGVELTFDTDTLMKEDLSLFGTKRAEILEKWDVLAGEKAENE